MIKFTTKIKEIIILRGERGAYLSHKAHIKGLFPSYIKCCYKSTEKQLNRKMRKEYKEFTEKDLIYKIFILGSSLVV